MLSLGLLAAIPPLGFHPEVEPLLERYFGVMLWARGSLLFYAAFRRYLQAIHAVTPVMVALVTANIVNAVGNWALIYGHLGLPAMGLPGSALATSDRAVYLAACCSSPSSSTTRGARAACRQSRRARASWLTRLLTLGFPAASTVALEVGVFAAATALAGRLTPVAAASHQIALNIAAVAFMVPLGLASAGAVRVGHAVGARIRRRAAAAGWTAILLGIAFMAVAASCFFLVAAPAHRPVHDATKPCWRSARRCSSSPPSFSCSTACRASRPACCAGSATRARR